MRKDWGELNARARGLTTRLLDRTALDRLAARESTSAVARELAGRGLVPEGEGLAATRAVLEDDLRRAVGRRIRLLESRAGSVGRALAVVFEGEDVRSLRKLLRGARAAAPPEERLAGLLPTPRLSAERLEALARAEDVDDLVRTLAEGEHPLAPDLHRAHETSGADLPALETALLAAHLGRARRSVSRGNPRLRRHVARAADLANAWTCLLSPPDARRTGDRFVEGGSGIDRTLYDRACQERDPAHRRRLLGEALGLDGAGGPLADAQVPLAELEGRTLRAMVAEERTAARRDPLSAAPLLFFVLAQRAELQDLRRILWGISLGAPAALVRRGLVTT